MATLIKVIRFVGDCARRTYSADSVIGFHAGKGAMAKCYLWYPGCIVSDKFSVGKGHICLVLNREIKIKPDVAKNIWQNAKARCTVDGGTNEWRKFLQKHSAEKSLKPPDVISGDFDSLTEETAQFFDSVPKVLTPDQSDTDFTKSIEVIKPIMEAMKINDIIVFHETSGRFDHIMGNINTILRMQSDVLNIYLLASNSMSWVLRPGKHTIHIPKDCLEKRSWCSLMPIGKAVHNVSTKGLKWDLSNADMEFGGLVSTSNTYSDDCVVIETKENLVWSMGVLKFDDSSQ